MKKLLSVVLAVAMVMAMGVVAFAAAPALTGVDLDAKEYSAKEFVPAAVVYGDTVYYVLNASGVATDYDSVAGLKIKENWEMGEDLVESVKVVKKYAENYGSQYIYALAVKVVANENTTDAADVVGEIKLTKKSAGFEFVLPVEFEVAAKTTLTTVDEVIDASAKEIDPDTAYAFKFAYDDEVTFTFGDVSARNEGSYTVDVSGQGKVVVKFDTKANEAIDAANPAANTKYVNFNGAKFNRTGEFFLDAGETYKYLYEVKDNAVVAIPTAEYDEYDEGFYFNTRVLGSYVLSDVELVNAAAEAVVVNPSTGAAA